MPPIPQMDLKALDAHPRTGIIQFSRTIKTADAGEVLEFDAARDFEGGEVGGGGEGVVGVERVDGGATHGAFEAGVGVAGEEGGEGGCEPGGWWGLSDAEMVSRVGGKGDILGEGMKV